MSKDYFEFRRFTVRQDRCAMKVGTDGTLLGAWAGMDRRAGRVLDIGTGTGLIALMMAQRYPDCRVVAIDIDADAVGQARENVEASPFAGRIDVVQADIGHFQSAELYDAIVSNPPFFADSLQSSDGQRTAARHTESLSYATLIASAFRLLADEGRFSLIIPVDCLSRLMAEVHLRGFFIARRQAVRTIPSKPPKRCLCEFVKHPVQQVAMQDSVLDISPGVRSPWYQDLTRDFYLR